MSSALIFRDGSRHQPASKMSEYIVVTFLLRAQSVFPLCERLTGLHGHDLQHHRECVLMLMSGTSSDDWQQKWPLATRTEMMDVEILCLLRLRRVTVRDVGPETCSAASTVSTSRQK